MDQLRIDPTLVFASAVGEENGIARAELDALAKRAGGHMPRAGDPGLTGSAQRESSPRDPGRAHAARRRIGLGRVEPA
jgi:hypothetical protein